MATLYITELRDLSFDPRGNGVMAPQMPSTVEQVVPIGLLTEPSLPFSAGTRYVMLNCDTACCLAWGEAPEAFTTAHRMGANETRFYGVRPGDRVAVIASI